MFNINKIQQRPLILLTFFTNMLGLFQYGYPMGVLNSTAQVVKQFINESFTMHYDYVPDVGQIDVLYGATNTGWDFGGMVGCLIAGRLADRFGRKYAIFLVSSTITVISAFLFGISYAVNAFEVLLLGRIISGVGSGIASICIPLYLTEFSPKADRGLFVGWQISTAQFWLLAGMVFSLPVVLGTATLWPYLFSLPAFPGLILIITVPWIPETPPYTYVVKNDVISTTDLIRKYHGEESNVEQTLDVYKKEAAVSQHQMNLLAALRNVGIRRGFIVSLVLYVANGVTGEIFLNHFSTTMFESLGFDTERAQLFSLVPCVIFVVFALTAPITLDKYGRRPLVLLSLLLEFIGFAVYVTFGAIAYYRDVGGWAPGLSIFGACFAAFGYSVGIGPVAWIAGAELVPVVARASTTTFGMAVGYFTAFLTGLVLPIGYATLGPIISIFLVTIPQVLIFVFLYYKMPETRGETQMDVYRELCDDDTPLLDSGVVDVFDSYRTFAH